MVEDQSCFSYFVSCGCVSDALGTSNRGPTVSELASFSQELGGGAL